MNPRFLKPKRKKRRLIPRLSRKNKINYPKRKRKKLKSNKKEPNKAQ